MADFFRNQYNVKITVNMLLAIFQDCSNYIKKIFALYSNLGNIVQNTLYKVISVLLGTNNNNIRVTNKIYSQIKFVTHSRCIYIIQIYF